MKEIKIGNKSISENSPCLIIAEISANHRQDFDISVRTIKAAREAGADAVKLQTFTPDTITINSKKDFFKIKQGTLWDGRTLYELYEEAYMPWEWQPKLKEIAKKENLLCFSSVFDKTAVDFLEEINVPAYKIASFEITDIPLIEYIASKGKPMIISTGIAEKEDIEEAINACKKQGNEQIILLKCTSAYPTPLEEVNLETIKDLERRFNVWTGVSDHTIGGTVPIASIALGAKIIEKHFILNKSLRGPDVEFSLSPEEFKKMIEDVRNTEKVLGKVSYELTEKMKKSREHSRSLFVVRDMKKDETINEENVRSIRPGYGIHPKYLNEVIGKKVNKDIDKGTPLSRDCIKEE